MTTKNNNPCRNCASWFVLALLLASTGCKTMTIPSPTAWFKPKVKDSKYDTPTHLAVIWSEDAFAQPGKPATRGFGGRIYFYNDKEQAIPVDGQLVVYGYDDSQSQNSPAREPSRKFAFTPDQFTKHFSKTDLGASYSIWIPWDSAATEQREVSLVPVFTSTSGTVVMGQPTVNLLAAMSRDGKRSQRNTIEVRRETESSSEVRPASHYEGTAGTNSEPAAPFATASQMRTSTIELPESLSRRMRNFAAPPALHELNVMATQPTNLQSLSLPNRLTNESMGSGTGGQTFGAGAIYRPTAAGGALPPQNPSNPPEDHRRSLPKSPAPTWPTAGASSFRAPIPPRPQEWPPGRPSLPQHSLQLGQEP